MTNYLLYKQIVDKSQWDDRSEEWIIPYIKAKSTIQGLKLPDIDSPHNGYEDYNEIEHRQQLSSRSKSSRPNSKDQEEKIDNWNSGTHSQHHAKPPVNKPKKEKKKDQNQVKPFLLFLILLGRKYTFQTIR